MKLIAVTLLLALSANGYAKISKDLGYNLAYRQLHYQLEDEQGDYALYTRVKMSPKAILYSTIGSNVKYQEYLRYIGEQKEKYKDHFNSSIKLMKYEEYKNREKYKYDPNFKESLSKDIRLSRQEKENRYADYLNNTLSFEGKQDPIKRKELVNAFIQVMREELSNGITPKKGTVHKWSNNFKYKSLDHIFPAASLSKMLSALALGRTYLYMITETEDDLADWMLSQEYNSITLPELYRASYKINNGDIYLSLLTIENLLSYHWMAKDRERLGPILRLRPINNFYQDKGDKYGSWYHLFGLILYGYVQGDIRSSFVSFVESVGSHIMGGKSEPQEDLINAAGGPIGAKLRKISKMDKIEAAGDHPEYLNEEYYLNLGEDFRYQLYFAHDHRFNLKFRKYRSFANKKRENDSYVSIDITSTLNYDLDRCKVDVFLIAKDRVNNELLSNKVISFPKEERKRIKVEGLSRLEVNRIKGIKLEVSSCENTDEFIQLTTSPQF